MFCRLSIIYSPAVLLNIVASEDLDSAIVRLAVGGTDLIGFCLLPQ